MHIVCCPSTTSITYTASSIQTPQYVPKGDSTTTYFAFSPFSHTAAHSSFLTSCPISYTTDDSTNIPNAATLVGSDMHFVPSDPSTDAVYTFKINANAEGGTTVQTTE